MMSKKVKIDIDLGSSVDECLQHGDVVVVDEPVNRHGVHGVDMLRRDGESSGGANDRRPHSSGPHAYVQVVRRWATYQRPDTLKDLSAVGCVDRGR